MDEAFIRRLRRPDDGDAWAELDSECRGRLRRLACDWGLSAADAEDVAQEVLLGLWRHLTDPQAASPEPLKGLRLTALLWRQAVGHLRARTRDARRWRAASEAWAGLAAVAPATGLGETDEDRTDEFERRLVAVTEALSRLRLTVGRRRLVAFDLYVLQGLTAKKVASLLGIKAAHLYVIKNQVCRLVRKELRSGADTAFGDDVSQPGC